MRYTWGLRIVVSGSSSPTCFNYHWNRRLTLRRASHLKIQSSGRRICFINSKSRGFVTSSNQANMEANISSDYGTGKCRSDEGLDKIQKVCFVPYVSMMLISLKSDKDNHTRNQGVELSTIAQEFMKEILLKKTYKTFVRQQGWEISCKITAPT